MNFSKFYIYTLSALLMLGGITQLGAQFDGISREEVDFKEMDAVGINTVPATIPTISTPIQTQEIGTSEVKTPMEAPTVVVSKETEQLAQKTVSNVEIIQDTNVTPATLTEQEKKRF